MYTSNNCIHVMSFSYLMTVIYTECMIHACHTKCAELKFPVFYLVKGSCDSILFNWKGEIKSLSNSGNNPDIVNCTWTIKTDPLRRIALSARTFNVKSGKYCMCNHVTVYDGKKSTKLCGQYFPTLYSNTNKLIIKSYGHPSENMFHFDYQAYFKGNTNTYVTSYITRYSIKLIPS